MTLNLDLTGHRALVTGAGQGVGEESRACSRPRAPRCS